MHTRYLKKLTIKQIIQILTLIRHNNSKNQLQKQGLLKSTFSKWKLKVKGKALILNQVVSHMIISTHQKDFVRIQMFLSDIKAEKSQGQTKAKLHIFLLIINLKQNQNWIPLKLLR